MTKRILTGLKPTGEQLHIGNYFGAIKPFIDLTHTEKDAEFFLPAEAGCQYSAPLHKIKSIEAQTKY